MRIVLVLLVFLFAGCVEEEIQCPECICPECPKQVTCPEQVISNDSSEDQEEIDCTVANITIVQINQTTALEMNETNISGEGVGWEEEELIGIPFANGSYTLVLDDVSYPTDGSCGIFSVRYKQNSSIINRLVICPGESKNWVSPEGRIYRLVVIEVAAGYTRDVKWAKVQIFG